MKTAAAAATILLVLAGFVVGCEDHPPPADIGSPPATSSSAPPARLPRSARPRELHLDDRDPCATVPQAAWARFSITRAIPQRHDPLDSPGCFFNSSRAAMGITLVLTQGVDFWAPGTRAAQPAVMDPVLGFPAYSLLRPRATTDCAVAVDVAPTQHLLADAVIDLNDLAAIPDRCAWVHEFAEVALRTLLPD